VSMNQHERNDLVILSYRHKFARWFDELNLHVINAWYAQRLHSRNAFDPLPIVNGEEGVVNSVSPLAKRFNYVFGAQGELSKTLRNTHKLRLGFLTELRPVNTQFAGLYYNANLLATAQAQQNAQAQKNQILNEGVAAAQQVQQQAFQAAIAAGKRIAQATAAGQAAFNQIFGQAQAQANAIDPNPLPYAAPISPFTGRPGGPLFIGNIGRFRGFRYLQSAYFQDTWRPTRGFLRRLTLDAGVRADVYHGVFGDTLKVAQAISTIPDVPPFLLQPFQKQTVTDAQASGRFGASLVVTRDTVLRGSFSNIFQPPPVDVFVTPPDVGTPINGIFNGTVRPLRATRGELVDTSLERQVGPRFVVRTNLFYKKLKNFGDSGVIVNTPIYNRLTLSNQEAYGVETRMDLKPDREGYGFNGFVSNTIQYARLRGSKGTTGGIFDVSTVPITAKFPDHDRRYELVSGLGYKTRRNFWILCDVQVFTGLPNRLPEAIFGAHPARTPVRTNLAVSAGYQLPKELRKSHRLWPVTMDVRVENLLNQRLPINLGSPFQGTRYSLPIRVLAGMNWEV